MSDIRDKVAIVTGAGRGIGRGIAIAYGRAGARVVVASRTESTVKDVVAETKSEGGSAIGITCDVGRRHEVFDLVDSTVNEFGTIDILVNNAQSFTKAGKVDSKHGRQPIETFDEDDWEALYRTGVCEINAGEMADDLISFVPTPTRRRALPHRRGDRN